MKLGAIAVFTVLLLTPAVADMGQIHVSSAGVAVSESAQKAIILVNGRKQVLILGTEMQATKPTPIVRFIPFPSEPTVQLAPKGVFDRMADLVRKYRLEYVTVFQSKGGGAKADTSGVEVRFAARMRGHDLTVIHVRDAGAIRAWVNRYFKKKHLPTRAAYAEAEKVVGDYVARGIGWFVVDAVELSPAGGAVAAVAYSFDSASLYYPLLTSNTFGGTGAIELYVLAPATLCAPGSNILMEEGDKAVDAAGREAGPCLGLNAKASTSALLVPQENDLAGVWPGADAMFAGKPVFLQAIRYNGAYRFERDVTVALPAGVARALAAPQPGENPFAPALLPEEHAACKQAPDRGPCKGMFERFHYDAASKSCKAFDWGGCAGSVPFETREDCEKTCTAAK